MNSKLNLGLLLAIIVLAANPLLAQKATVAVTGMSVKEVNPQKVKVEAYVKAREGSSEKAHSQTVGSTEDVLEYIQESMGIGNAAVSAVNIKPWWNSVEEEYEYIAVQHITFEIDSLMGYQSLIEKVMDKGVSGVTSVKYMVKDADQQQSALLGQAYNNAKAKATTLASDMGMKIGKAISVKELRNSESTSMEYVTIDPNIAADAIFPSKVVLTSKVEVTFEAN